MNQQASRLLLIPVDGSSQSLKSLEYINFLFGKAYNAHVQLLYVIPPLPPILVEESKHDRDMADMLKKVERKHLTTANDALHNARRRLLTHGFDKDRIQTVVKMQVAGVARGICSYAEDKAADAIVMCTRGRSRLQTLFLGSTATKVADTSQVCPVWLVKNAVVHNGILIGVDTSDAAMRAVDHAGFMLADTDHPITLYYSRRNLMRFAPREVINAAPGLEDAWQTRAGKEISPVMEKANRMLLDAGVDASRISTRVAEGSRNAGADIIKAADNRKCGTIVMGRHGESGHTDYAMGSVTRTVVQELENKAVWIVS